MALAPCAEMVFQDGAWEGGENSRGWGWGSCHASLLQSQSGFYSGHNTLAKSLNVSEPQFPQL